MGTASVVLIVVAIVGLVVVAMAVQSLIITLRSLRSTVDELRTETHSAVAEMRAMVAEANGEIARVDSLLDTAEVVGARVEATSRLAWLVMRTPLVKLASSSVASDRSVRRVADLDEVEVIRPRAIDGGAADRVVGSRRGRRSRGARTSSRRAS